MKFTLFTLNNPKPPDDLIPIWDYGVEVDENTLRYAPATTINAFALLGVE